MVLTGPRCVPVTCTVARSGAEAGNGACSEEVEETPHQEEKEPQ